MPAVAQEDTSQEKPDATEENQESTQENQKKDNTGTNPVNFTYDARFYIENSWLDGGSLIAPTFEFRWPMGIDLLLVPRTLSVWPGSWIGC